MLKYQKRIRLIILGGLLAMAANTIAQTARQCPPQQGVALQVLGSGGPIADDGRASAGYIVWVHGESRMLIDAGGGTFLRFGEAGASFEELDFVGISHFHTDHSADLPALLKSGYFTGRERSLSIAGPDGSDMFPGLASYLQRMLDEDEGAYGYLSGYLNGSGGLPTLEPLELGRSVEGSTVVMGDSQSDIQISAMHVPHGIVPSLAYRVRIGDVVIAFSGDQNGDDPRFIKFAENATLLVMHMPVPEGVEGVARRLHALPSLIARIANQSNAKTLLLSHFMARSLVDLQQSVKTISALYDGNILLAEDLNCIALDG
ncbi:Ribonuclease BN [Halioglobus japonicus]|nr:Ribonuclease BN [Halioglobus japonicus]